MSTAKITSYSLYEKNLPESFDSFKIAHISDPHSNPADGVYEIIKDSEPDIIVITGDLVHDDDKPYDKISSLIKKLSAISPVYAVTGNHDMWHIGHEKIIQNLENSGVKFLRGEMIEIKKGEERIALFGLDDPFSKLPDKIDEKIRTSLSALPEFDGFKILLFHRRWHEFDPLSGS